MDFKQQKAIYRQIADYLLDNIIAGNINSGSRIASVREMAASVQVNPNTVVRSYSFLQDKGIIYNQRGIGYFVSEDGLKKSQNLKKDQFVEQYLPELFKTMKLLEIEFEELRTIYENQSGAS